MENIKKNVVDNLYWDTRVDSSDIKITTEDGKVTLTGEVPSYNAMEAAIDNVWNVAGVKSVNNKLNVQFPAKLTVPSDDDIQSNIQNILLWDIDIDSTDINISVNNGIVSLEGTVDSFWKLYHIENKANVTGVKEIVNKLAVVPTAEVVDEDIAKDVVKALERNINVDVDNVNVEVEDGEVTLSGTVTNWTAYRAAENSAFYTLGVTGVDNQLTINY